MRKPASKFWVLGVVLTLGLTSVAWGQSEKLKKAVDLYDQQEYADAQTALLQVDRDKLTDSEKDDLDAYLKDVSGAIKSAEKAAADSTKADKAFENGGWDEAEKLYRGVVANLYAKADLRETASQRIERIAENREMAAAVAPQPKNQPQLASQEQPQEAAAAQTQETTQRPTLTSQLRERDNLLWQRAYSRMEANITKARQAVAAKNFETARKAAQSALQLIEEARNYAEPVSKYHTAKLLAEQIKAEVADAQREFEMERAAEEREQIKIARKTAKERMEKKRREQIEQLFNSAAKLRKEQRFREAAEMLRQIRYLEPANAKARDQLEIAEDYDAISRQVDIKRDFDDQMRRTFMDAEATLVPWVTEVLYPSNWRQLSLRRSLTGLGSSGESDESRELNRKLEENISEVPFQDQPLEGVVEWLQELKQVNISVDWDDLEANGIERDKPITLNLTNLPFRTVLNEVLSQAGGEIRLAYNTTDGLFKIATKEKLDRDKSIRVFDINDLLVDIPRFTNAAHLNPAEALNQIGRAGRMGGSGQLFADDQNDQRSSGNGSRNDVSGGGGGRGRIAEDIMEIIRLDIEPESWRETGAGDASLRELNGQLIVYNTSDAHRQVADLLSQLREFRALQISIETRFLTVTNNFLEEIGVDLDFVFNSGTANFDQAFTGGGAPIIDPFTGAAVLIPRTSTLIGGLPNVPGFTVPFTNPVTGGLVGAVPTGIGQPFQQPGWVPRGTGVSPNLTNFTPIRMGQNSLSLVNPANFQSGVPGSFANVVGSGNPALSIAGSFLDNLQVDFLIRATQANSRSSVVQAPRLILFNGQRANIFVGRSQTYVSSLQPQIAQQAVAFAPIIGVAQSGSTLDVDATISADRKYVTVTVRTQRAQDPLLTRFEVQRASGNAPGAFITTVDQQSTSINTTVSIPDGGTVLLGGQKLVGEFEVEAGVPILSKIPILKRAFTNTTTVKDTLTMLILMKAKIIIQKEAEEEAFPSMATGG